MHGSAQEDLNILGPIGEGAFGDVSLAHSPIFGKVATKWLKPSKVRARRLSARARHGHGKRGVKVAIGVGMLKMPLLSMYASPFKNGVHALSGRRGPRARHNSGERCSHSVP